MENQEMVNNVIKSLENKGAHIEKVPEGSDQKYDPDTDTLRVTESDPMGVIEEATHRAQAARVKECGLDPNDPICIAAEEVGATMRLLRFGKARGLIDDTDVSLYLSRREMYAEHLKSKLQQVSDRVLLKKYEKLFSDPLFNGCDEILNEALNNLGV